MLLFGIRLLPKRISSKKVELGSTFFIFRKRLEWGVLMKHFERTAGLWHRFKRNYERSRCEKYCHLILSGKIRVWDVPSKWRQNFTTARVIYITGFRVARGISLERFEEELNKLDLELILLSVDPRSDPELVKRLQRLYEEKRAELESWKWREWHKKFRKG